MISCSPTFSGENCTNIYYNCGTGYNTYTNSLTFTSKTTCAIYATTDLNNTTTPSNVTVNIQTIPLTSSNFLQLIALILAAVLLISLVGFMSAKVTENFWVTMITTIFSIILSLIIIFTLI